ncbi:GNAT family N-acetyltransferase [Corynebacterium sp. TAE3-ERU12]|uniref:GNAT family N-acetyltransferase n=1 Tax=Corynebacterium sp. TAE3-ERU12 TaxID=2849491 RepID=UPI001C437347|nr:GNAT family N-acetyltransferase [Corynebacterium sp. TAE3-ERU12]MBV7295710.1 GNAT family N-acetyltransferase [Corynebacterium sp. TAE3-ERU12]
MSDKKREFSIRPMREEDYPQVQAIYEIGLDTGHASWEHEAPEWDVFARLKRLDLCFVATLDDNPDKIVAWASASQVSKRDILRGVIEDSIYVHPDGQGMGLAGALLSKVMDEATELGCWSIHSWVFPENVGSLKVHQKYGFREVGVYHHMAKMTYGPKAGEWRDIIILEKLLEKPEERAEKRALQEAEEAGDPTRPILDRLDSAERQVGA